jgi:hypothetical protein
MHDALSFNREFGRLEPYYEPTCMYMYLIPRGGGGNTSFTYVKRNRVIYYDFCEGRIRLIDMIYYIKLKVLNL